MRLRHSVGRIGCGVELSSQNTQISDTSSFAEEYKSRLRSKILVQARVEIVAHYKSAMSPSVGIPTSRSRRYSPYGRHVSNCDLHASLQTNAATAAIPHDSPQHILPACLSARLKAAEACHHRANAQTGRSTVSNKGSVRCPSAPAVASSAAQVEVQG